MIRLTADPRRNGTHKAFVDGDVNKSGSSSRNIVLCVKLAIHFEITTSLYNEQGLVIPHNFPPCCNQGDLT